MDRRSILLGASAGIASFKTSVLFAQNLGMITEGPAKAPPATDALVDQVIAILPVTTDYVAIMKALEALKDNTFFRSPDNEPFSYRWKRYGNPLLIKMWKDMGWNKPDDCEEWCAIAIGWCLKRSGRDVPANVQNSQSFLNNWGTFVDTPQLGDIAVFTDDAPANRGRGHVTVFRKFVDADHLTGLGGNQDLPIASNCPHNHPVSAINDTTFPIDTRPRDAQGEPICGVSGWHINKYVRPPAPVRAPTPAPKLAGPVKI